ncbi:MAG: hypothetical protein CMG98_14190 [Marinovum sp.]|nr:hypothetical protein [Marinovum sp.]
MAFLVQHQGNFCGAIAISFGKACEYSQSCHCFMTNLPICGFLRQPDNCDHPHETAVTDHA